MQAKRKKRSMLLLQYECILFNKKSYDWKDYTETPSWQETITKRYERYYYWYCFYYQQAVPSQNISGSSLLSVSNIKLEEIIGHGSRDIPVFPLHWKCHNTDIISLSHWNARVYRSLNSKIKDILKVECTGL